MISTCIFQPLVTLGTDPLVGSNSTTHTAASHTMTCNTKTVPSVSKIQLYSELLSPTLHPRIKNAKTLLGIYGLAWSCVLLWRGTWMGWDLLYESMMMTLHRTDTLDHSHKDDKTLVHLLKVKNHFLRATEQVNRSVRSSWIDIEEGKSTAIITLDEILEGTHDCFFCSKSSSFLVRDTIKKEIHSESAGPIMDRTLSGLTSHLTSVVFMTGFGLLASVFAPPARIAVLRDARFTFKWK